MALLAPDADGAPRQGMAFSLRCAGAESNFAIALQRLEIGAAWISRLGTDVLGDLVHDALGEEGVDLRWVVRDPNAPTGLFLKWRADSTGHNLYYRRGSAASRLRPTDVPDAALDGVNAVHLTGITTALSASARETVLDVARRAHARGISISFDPNYRPALWDDPAAAAAAHRELLPLVRWYLCGLDEGRCLFGVPDAPALFDVLETAGVGGVIVRVGADGALVRADGAIVTVPPPRVVDIFDEIGAGDGFAAGFTWGWLTGCDTVDAVRAGHVVAASALGASGDWESYVGRDALLRQLQEA
jgi:sugar/nucleoside kinase (ribokinase family)